MNKSVRSKNLLVKDIKRYRDLTFFLGKLGIANKYLYRQNPPPDMIASIRQITGTRHIRVYHFYGLGLAECKYIVERNFTYE
jgi:hypothetical protein